MAEAMNPNFDLFKAMKTAGNTTGAARSDLLHSNGSAVDNDVIVKIPEDGKNALIPFLESIPGVFIDDNTKAIALDSRHIVMSSLALRADLAYNNEQQWIDVGISFDQKPTIEFSRIVDGEGLGVKLKFDEESNFIGAEIRKTENWDRQGQSGKGAIDVDSNGKITSSFNDLKNYKEGSVNLVQLLNNITNPQGLDQKIDFDTVIPIVK